MTKLRILNTPKKYSMSKTRRLKSSHSESDIYTNEGVTIMKNIPHIIWSSLNIYPEIHAFFHNLDNRYLDKTVRTIFLDMGIIKVLEYTRIIRSSTNLDMHEYTIHGIAKYSPTRMVDNLFYEYLVGICCINNLTKKFPIFIFTHGIYTISNVLRKRFVKKEQIPGKDLCDGLYPFDITDYSLACKDSNKICLILQYCHGMINLSKIKNIPYYQLELCLALFQIYYTLAQCKYIYTHYDLHDDNCGLILIPGNACIVYEYHVTDASGHSKTVRFCSKYIVKIFDYGKSYFSGVLPNGSTISSKMIYKKVSATHACRPLAKHGFIKHVDEHINQSVVNNSHDLRLIHLLKNICMKIPALMQFSKDLVYNEYYGTPSIPSSTNGRIQTVDDACIRLCDIISIISPDTGISIAESSFEIYKSYISMGTIHVWGIQTDMHFEPNIAYKE